MCAHPSHCAFCLLRRRALVGLVWWHPGCLLCLYPHCICTPAGSRHLCCTGETGRQQRGSSEETQGMGGIVCGGLPSPACVSWATVSFLCVLGLPSPACALDHVQGKCALDASSPPRPTLVLTCTLVMQALSSQLATSMVLDLVGAAGFARRAFSWQVIVGVLLLVVGAVLMSCYPGKLNGKPPVGLCNSCSSCGGRGKDGGGGANNANGASCPAITIGVQCCSCGQCMANGELDMHNNHVTNGSLAIP